MGPCMAFLDRSKITLHPSRVMKIIGPSFEIFEPISDTHLLDDVPTSVSVNCRLIQITLQNVMYYYITKCNVIMYY